ncbi:MAG: DegT/DnrJ/EryC1/StrS family aminotransferase [Microthrixaceae bacterium]
MNPSHDPVPFVDLGWQHAEIAAEVEEGFGRVLDATAFIDGPDVAAFEDEFAAFSGRGHCIGVANGTDAIELALRAHGIGRGDEVILPANTFIATAEAVDRAGATPVLVDCDERHLLIDPDLVAERLTAHTRAVIGVHLYGQIAPMERLVEVVRAAGDDRVVVLEDAAQAQGATRHGEGIGSWGTAATSFYPGKNLGAYGDGGAVLTDDDEVDRRVRAIRNHGSSRRYYHDVKGVNSRLDTLQAVVLRAKLARLEKWNTLRREAAERYEGLLHDVEGVELPGTMEHNLHVWHLYVVRVDRREAVMESLRDAGVGVAIHYPVPVHRHPAFADLGLAEGTFPVAESTAPRIMSLPMFPGITATQQERVATELRRALG